jgi:hypothetical protein
MGTVYLVGDWEKENFYKIGVTRGDIDKRIKKLQTGNGGEIYLVSKYETEHPFLMEKMLHLRFNNERVMNEWFMLDSNDVIHFVDNYRDIEETIEALKDNYFFKKKL